MWSTPSLEAPVVLTRQRHLLPKCLWRVSTTGASSDPLKGQRNLPGWSEKEVAHSGSTWASFEQRGRAGTETFLLSRSFRFRQKISCYHQFQM